MLKSHNFRALHHVAVASTKHLLTARNGLLFKGLATTQFTDNSGTFEFLLELLERFIDWLVFFDRYDNHDIDFPDGTAKVLFFLILQKFTSEFLWK